LDVFEDLHASGIVQIKSNRAVVSRTIIQHIKSAVKARPPWATASSALAQRSILRSATVGGVMTFDDNEGPEPLCAAFAILL
jgi:hypothetical protein